MSAWIQLLSVVPLDTPCSLTAPVKLQITFEAYEDLPDPVEWEMMFAWDGDVKHDQVLESVDVGPIKGGKHQFVFEANPPDYTKVPDEDLTDVAVLFLRVKYHDQLFSKVAFFVSHYYTDEELLKEPPVKPVLEKLERSIHLEDLRVTNIPIKWREQDELLPKSEGDEEVEEPEEEGMEDVAVFTAEPDSTTVLGSEQQETVPEDPVTEKVAVDSEMTEEPKEAFADKTNE
ncbi:unnamed protein product [Bursaphelenchus okinawaensis]|uniref:Anti-silencing factor n=1 Tax=Bursaphelenchus okinawaensis TaxID=465554 RepID=A0A811K1Q4_9BILA|nr:unnamed protein product [Bursaphelenchus okinawaensis]CAG9089110.1 unnamed protein product [Bursaphelenchus okinawaensis]